MECFQYKAGHIHPIQSRADSSSLKQGISILFKAGQIHPIIQSRANSSNSKKGKFILFKEGKFKAGQIHPIQSRVNSSN
jgi:hypothetical protein